MMHWSFPSEEPWTNKSRVSQAGGILEHGNVEIARLHVGNRVQRGVVAPAELSLRIFETVDRAVRALRRMDFERAAKHALRKAQVIATSVC
ncbi:hypothetical protein HFO41_34975 [Rhizobium leguminosarum]|uniref:hypothetical protein n=1 Tax=Rhizobium leguminosarum TaxID=384 RepID=UPI001C962A7C|nr:hypothetical protein [Rhizobium leguminosarum]MBY5565573.1 hypothetical protein [Rhizobium leguminosarum]MBY5626414.1 hypothetical protein [Rhizobium leguminosarum]MBY5693954.1 hypothetical protein [Rhizobium leguminosarum]MBY5735310.1 hypothetical protein [Rhizobium leguminosarum]